MDRRLFYVAPTESMDFILKNGIFTPNEVVKQIEEGKLTREVLGVSYGMDSSNFPEYVSMLSLYGFTTHVAQAISESRTGSFQSEKTRAITYVIDPKIREMPEFINEEETKKKNRHCYPSECLFRGSIPREFIINHLSATTW